MGVLRINCESIAACTLANNIIYWIYLQEEAYDKYTWHVAEKILAITHISL